MKPEDIKVDGYYQVYRYDSHAMPLADRVYHVVWMDEATNMLWYHAYDLRGIRLNNGNTQYDNKKHFASIIKSRVKLPNKLSKMKRRKHVKRYYN
jgi:hypothetical protein